MIDNLLVNLLSVFPGASSNVHNVLISNFVSLEITGTCNVLIFGVFSEKEIFVMPMTIYATVKVLLKYKETRTPGSGCTIPNHVSESMAGIYFYFSAAT